MNREVALAYPGLRMFEMSFVRGEQFTFAIPVDFARDRCTSYIAHVEGSVEVRRAIDNSDLVDVKSAGFTTNMTLAFQKPGPLPQVGRMMYRVLTDKYRYYCLNRKDGKPITVDDIRLASGQQHTVPVGRVAVRVMGGDVQAFDEGQVVSATADNTLLLEVHL